MVKPFQRPSKNAAFQHANEFVAAEADLFTRLHRSLDRIKDPRPKPERFPIHTALDFQDQGLKHTKKLRLQRRSFWLPYFRRTVPFQGTHAFPQV